MAEQRPLVIISGRVQQLPTGDTVAGATGGGAFDPTCLVTVWNAGDPQLVFDSNAEVVTYAP